MTSPFGLDEAYEMVREFHLRLGLPVGEEPAWLASGRARARMIWMLEELVEFREAPDVVGQTDALVDLLYLVLGTLVEMGVWPGQIFEIVHEANLAKAPSPDGAGKAVKGPDWRGPEEAIRQVLRGQSGQAKTRTDRDE